MKAYLMLAAVVAILQLLNHISLCVAIGTFSGETKTDFIKTSCNAIRFPNLCYNSLKIYAGEIQTNPKILAHTALSVALEFAKQTHATVKKFSTFQGLGPLVRPTICDYEKQLDITVEELQNCKDQLCKIVQVSNSGFQISNFQTWVSGALTNENTCMDGFGEITLKGKVEFVSYRHIAKVAQLTINALTLINSYAVSTEVSLH